MGLSASASRHFMLYARKSDLEFRGQSINSQRLALSNLSQAASSRYSDKLQNTTTKVQYDGAELEFNKDNLSLVNLVPVYTSGGQPVGSNMSSALLEEGLRNGSIELKYIDMPESADPPNGTVQWDANTAVSNRLFTEDDAAASAAYTAETKALQSKDQRLELELKAIEIQHSATQTEIDAVKKVIDKNIEKSFKTFG